MATTNGPSPRRSPSRDPILSNNTDNLQINGTADQEYHRGSNGAGESPYSSSNMRGHVSAGDLHEHVAGANSAATSDSGRASLGGGPTGRRLVAPQTKASKSSQPAAYAHEEPFVPDRADLPRRGADVPHDRAAPALSTSMSSDLLAPNSSHITQRTGGPMRPSRSISSNEEPHTATSPLTSKETSKLSRTMPLNLPPHATTSHTTPKNTAKPSRQIVANGHTSYEPPQGEKVGSGPPRADKDPPRGTNPKRPEPQGVDPPILDQTPAKQHDHRPTPPKNPPTSGRSSPSPAPVMTKAYSRRAQEPAPGEPQAPRGTLHPENPFFPNENREAAPSKTKGGHDPLNGQPAPTNISSLAADISITPSIPTAEHRPPTPPKATARLNSPSLLRVDQFGSEYNHGTSESRDISQSVDSATVIGRFAVAETSLTPPPPALLRPLDGIVGRNSSTSSRVVSSSDDGRGFSPRSNGVERRQSSRHAETTSRSASRRPQTEAPQNTGMSNQGREPTLSPQSGSEGSGSADVSPRPTGMERRQSRRHAETMSRSASRRPQTEGGPQSTGMSNQFEGREPTLPSQSEPERSGSVDVSPRPTGMERRPSNRHAETMFRSASRRPQMEGPQGNGMSNQGREPTLSSRPQEERSDSTDDVPPPPPYAPKVTPPTPVAEEGPLTGTGRERERTSPRTSPTAPIRTHQPERLDPMQAPLSLYPSLSRNNSHRSSNAAPASAASSTEAPRGQAKDARLVAQPETVVPIETEPPKQNVINIFCCCSSRAQ